MSSELDRRATYVRVTVGRHPNYVRRRRLVALAGILLAVAFFIGMYAFANHEYQNVLEHCREVGFTAAQCDVIVNGR